MPVYFSYKYLEMKFMSNFSKILLGKNIRFIATQKGIKVGDIENEAGVSAGYVSRLANEDNKNNFPIMDLILLISKKFEVSVNTLLSVDFSRLTPNEILLSQFFDKLSNDTENNSIVWELESQTKLDNCKQNGGHPLFFAAEPNNLNSDYFYHSTFDSNVIICGDCYKVVVGNKWLYMMSVQKEGNFDTNIELYFVSINYNRHVQTEPICRICKESALYPQINDLRNAAAESSRHVKLSDSVRTTITEYLAVQNSEDIPF